MIIERSNLEKFRQYLGAKTLRLKELAGLGLNVPDFVAVPSNVMGELFDSEGGLKTEKLEFLAKDAAGALGGNGSYAVRSSALIEDDRTGSLAGQFLTKTDVKREELAVAIHEVIKHADSFLSGDLERFSLIIQRYVEPDISGVAFTRNAFGTREMVLEYSAGKGEEVVGGKIKPRRAQFFWHGQPNINLPKISEAIENFKKIEDFYKFPQDIEWCVKGGEWYYLQSRPITSISDIQYAQILYLEDSLPKDKKFHFEKTEISEIAPRPTPLTQDILKKIYAQNGPVDSVYKKHGISYKEVDFLKIIGNELYCDTEKERKTLSGFVRTLKNAYALNRIFLEGYNDIFAKLKEAAAKSGFKKGEFSGLLNDFLKDYEIVFEINLFAGIATKRLKSALKSEKDVGIPFLLAVGSGLVPEIGNFKLEVVSQSLEGNSLEIADESDFSMDLSVAGDAAQVNSWIDSRPGWMRGRIKSLVKDAVIYNRLRELGRYLVVSHINLLRNLVFEIATKNNFGNVKNIYFSHLDEISQGKISEQDCEKRKTEYEKYLKFNLPRVIESESSKSSVSAPVGVSMGVARGVLVEEKNIDETAFGNRDKILYVKILSPDLVRYFDKIKGIVSEQGGMLSHLAIMAREKKISVIVNFDLAQSGFKLFNEIEMDGQTGKIEKI